MRPPILWVLRPKATSCSVALPKIPGSLLLSAEGRASSLTWHPLPFITRSASVRALSRPTHLTLTANAIGQAPGWQTLAFLCGFPCVAVFAPLDVGNFPSLWNSASYPHPLRPTPHRPQQSRSSSCVAGV